MTLFYNKYFNLFVFMKFEPGDYIMSENEEAKYLYILKKGEYEISFKKSVGELNETIKKMGGISKHNLLPEDFLGSNFYDKQMKNRKTTKVLLKYI